MRLQPLKQLKHLKHLQHPASLSFYLKGGAIFLLFALSVLIVACSSTSSDNTTLGNPQVTVTINLNQSESSPTPPLPEYACGAWVTNTTPPYNTTSIVDVYAKFIHNVPEDDNPVGVGNASAVATVLWPGGSTSTVTATTTSDGLAVFPVSVTSASFAINKLVLVTVTFNSSDGHTCKVDQNHAAYFTLVIATPMATGTAVSTGTPSATGTPSGPPKHKKKPTPTATP